MSYIRLPNSVCLNKVLHNQNVRLYSTQDLCRDHNRLKESQKTDKVKFVLSHKDITNIQEEVNRKQTELVRLAEQHGTYDKKVLDLQIRLVRSKSFRV